MILFTFTTNLYSAEIPSKWRFEYSYGQIITHYQEDQPSIVFDETDIEQKSDFHQFAFQYFLLPPYIDLTLGGNTTGTQTTEPTETEKQFKYYTVFANLGILLPISDYWNIKLVGESFLTSMTVVDNEFGFRNLKGYQVYPEIEWLPFGSDIFIQISPYLKVPIWSKVSGNRKESTAGIKMKIPLGSDKSMKFPTYAYQTALSVKVFYTEMNMNFSKDNFIGSEIKVRQYGATVGFNF